MTVRQAHAASYLRRLVHRLRARQIARGVAGAGVVLLRAGNRGWRNSAAKKSPR